MNDITEAPKSSFRSMRGRIGLLIDSALKWWRSKEDTVIISKKYQSASDVEATLQDFGTTHSTEFPSNLSESSFDPNHLLLHYDMIKSNLIEMLKARFILNRFQYPDETEFQNLSDDQLKNVFRDANRREINNAFLWAAFTRRWDLFSGFLELGAQLNYHDPNHGLSALHLAAFSGCQEGIELLLCQEGSDPDVMHKYYTPLHCSAFGDSSETAQILLSKGANIDAVTSDVQGGMETALHCSVRANALNSVKFFCDIGANINHVDKYGRSPIHLAAELGSTECLKILVATKGVDVNLQTKEQKETPLHLAAAGQYADCIDVLLENGACPKITNNRNETPLHLAAKVHSDNCMKILLQKGRASPNARDNIERTPLHILVAKADRCQSIDVIKTFIRYGADINAKDHEGFTPLHLAALNEQPDCVRVLINYGADFSIKSKSGVSAFAMMAKKTPGAFDAITNKFNKYITLKFHSECVNEVELQFDFKTGLNHPNEYALLNAFIEARRKDFLLHPFCMAFLYITWCRIRRCYYGMIYHAMLFTSLLVLYVLTSLAYDCDKQTVNTPNATVRCNNTSDFYKMLKNNPVTIQIQWYILFSMTLSLLYRKAYGFRGYPSVRQYLLNWGNVLEWHGIVYVFIISFIYTGQVETWQVQTGGFAVICSFTNVMFLIGQLPVFGPYVDMFQKVQTEFFKLLLVYSSFFLGYTVGFCVLFPNSPHFANPLIGLISTMVMMTGEMNYDLLLNYDQEQNSTSSWGKMGAHVLYLLFILFMAIILMNLVVGIAVHDIQGLQKTADVSRLVRQAKVSSYIELAHLNRSQRSQCIMKLFKVIPKPYIGTLKVKPSDPAEDKLPRTILNAAYDLVKNKNTEYKKNVSQARSKGTYCKALVNNTYKQIPYDPKTAVPMNRLMHKLDNHYREIKILRKEIEQLKTTFINCRDTSSTDNISN